MLDIICNFFHKAVIILFFNCITFIPIIKANQTIDKLLNQLSKPISEINRVEILNELAFLELDNNNIQASKQYINEALTTAKKIGYDKGITDAQVRLGTVAQIEGQYIDAIKMYEEALVFRKLNDTNIAIASIYNQIGICHFLRNNFDEAIKNYQRGLGYLNSQNKSRVKGSILHNLSELHTKIENHNLAIIYLDSCIQIWTQLEDKKTLVRTLQRLGHLYKELNNFDEALKSFKQSLRLAELNNFTKEQAKANIFLGDFYYDYETNQIDLAHKFYSAAEKQKNYLEKNNQAILYKNLGNIFRDKNKVDQSLEYYSVSLTIFKEIDTEDLDWDLASLYFEMGNIYKKLKQYPKAKKYYLDCLAYFGEDYHPFDKANAFLNLSEVYEQLGEKVKAVQFYKRHSELKDSIYFNRIDAVNLQHNLEKERKEKTKLIAESLEKAKINQRNNFLIALLVAGVLILTAMLALYRNRQKRQFAEIQTKEALLETQQAQLETNKAYMEIDNLLQNQELVIAQARLDEKDTTYKQISKDLHDGLGVMLSTIKLYFDDFSDQLKDLKKENNQKRNKTFDLLDEAVNEVRRISHNMQTGTLKKIGLAEAIKDLGTTINDSGQLNVKVYTHGLKERIANKLEYKLYKIIQELVGNALKHAKATKLSLYLNHYEDSLNIIVEDDGIGFDIYRIGDKDGIGLKNITYRVTKLGGFCHFDSTKDKGTTVIIYIPFKNDEQKLLRN